jgi:septum formation protein
MEIILASTSAYRKALLERLQLPFHCRSPNTIETPLSGESAQELCARLATDKARSLSAQFPDAVIIGSDQVASLGKHIITKPGNHEAAMQQLQASSGRTVHFHTGLAVIAPAQGLELLHVEPFKVHFRDLTDSEIDSYLKADRPYDCAGSFKVESLGISLFTALEGQDPTSLIGLPLIALTQMLRQAGVNIL